MTTPPAPAPPADPAPPAPAPAPSPTPPPAPKDGDGDPLQVRLDKAVAALEEERRLRKAAEVARDKAAAATMTDAEKQLAAAKAEGRAEVVKANGIKLAAATFRALAAGKIADPAAMLEVLDLAPFVGEDGEVDEKRLGEVVDKLAAASPAPAPAGRVPAGPQNPAPGADDDFLGRGMRLGRGA